MPCVSTIQPDQATGAAAEIIAVAKKASGKVPNAHLSTRTHNPAAPQALLSADDKDKGTRSKKSPETINLAVSAATFANAISRISDTTLDFPSLRQSAFAEGYGAASTELTSPSD